MTALSNVAADMLKRVGMNVDYQATDFGTVVQRRTSTKPPAEGGWNLLCIGASGLDAFTPATHLSLRCNGRGAGYGWPNDPKLEELRESWLDAPDLATQQRIAKEIQLQAFHEIPYFPIGLTRLPTAVRPDITGVLQGFALFWNVRRI